MVYHCKGEGDELARTRAYTRSCYNHMLHKYTHVWAHTHAHSHIQEDKHTHEHALAQMHTHIKREMTKRGELFYVKKDGLNAS